MATAIPTRTAFTVPDDGFLAVLGPSPHPGLVVATDAHEGGRVRARRGPARRHDRPPADGAAPVEPLLARNTDTRPASGATSQVCGPGGISILSADGDRLFVRLPEAPHDLAWGDADGRSLYVTALGSVYPLRLGVTGVRS